MDKKISRFIKWLIGVFLIMFFVFLLFKQFNLSTLTVLTIDLFKKPGWLIALITGYTISFLLRAWCWSLLVDTKIPFRVYIAGIFYSLFVNHLLPFKGGEAVRMGVLAQEANGRWRTAIQSVLLLRTIDLLWLGVFAVLGAGLVGIDIHLTFVVGLLAIIVATVFISYILRKKYHSFSFVSKQLASMKKLGSSPHILLILFISGVSWVAEGIVVFGIASNAHSFTYWNAMWVTALSVGSGVFQLAPGGFATYESVMSFSLNRIGFGMEEALSIAIVTHAFKYLYSFGAGIMAFYLYPLSFRKMKSFIKKGEPS